MANLINTIRTMYESPEDNMPASPDEGKMAYAQCEFIEYASEEICDYIENGGNFPEWFQNKLTKAHEQMKDLHAFIEGEKRATGTGQDPEEPEEMDEAMDPVNKKALKKDFDDRKDKDIDNDGDTDDSDEYLHNRRKAVSKAIKGEGKGEKIDVKPKLDEEAVEEAVRITKDKYIRRGIDTTTAEKGSKERNDIAKSAKKLRKDDPMSYTGRQDANISYKGVNVDRFQEEMQIDEAKITHSDESSPGKGKRMTDLTKSQHMDAADHHDREQMIAYKKKQAWNEKHHAMMAKAHRMHAQGGSSMMHKEDKEVTEGKIYASDYETSSEKSQFGGHRPVVKNKKTGKTMYQGSTSYHKPEHAKGHADAYLQGYAQYGEYGANKQSQSYQKAHQKHVKEGLEIQEGLETRIGGGKVPVGQHTLHYKTDKSHKYISNSIKERDPNAKITGKDGHTVVHATAQAHSSVIKSLRDFRTNGVVHDTQASNMKEETMEEGTMSRYELIKKAAQKINKADKKAARDASKGIKKDKDLKKVRNDPADRAAPEINEGNAAAELKKYANSKGGIDKQDFIAIANMLAKNKSAKDLAMVLKAQDTDPRDKALEIINKADKKLGSDIAKAMGMRQLRAWKEEVELDEARRDAPKGDKNTSAQNPIVVVYDDLGIKGRAGISGNMNLKTFMSIHGISAKHQGTLAKLVAKMGKGRKVEVPSNMLDDHAKEYKDEGKRVPKVWIELNTMKEEVELDEGYKQDAKNAPFKADPEKKKKEKNSDGTETSPMSKAKQLAKKGLVSEAEMTPAQKRKKEEIVKGMKDKKDYFERKYGDRAKDVMYATATKMAMKEGFELSDDVFEAYVAPSDGGPDGGGTPPVYTTKKGTNYKNGKAIGPVSDPDGGSATPAPKKEEKEVKEMVGKNGTVTPSKLAKNDADKQGVGVKYSQGGSGKVGLSSTDTAQPFAGATSAKKATVSPTQRLRNLLGK